MKRSWPACRSSAAGDPLRKTLSQTADKAETIRKKIVATKTGGAITGELRLREYAIELYDTLTYYEGRPGDYQVARIDSLKRELDDVVKQFDDFLTKEVDAVESGSGAEAAGPGPRPAARRVGKNQLRGGP